MARQIGSIDKWKRVADLTLKALDTLEHVMDTGSKAERVTAAKLILDRGMPAIRANPTEIGRALGMDARGVGAGGGHLAALLARAQARIARPADTTDTPDTPDTGP